MSNFLPKSNDIFFAFAGFVDERRHGGAEHNQDEAVQGETSEEEVVQVFRR